jgi:hypothetical protein
MSALIKLRRKVDRAIRLEAGLRSHAAGPHGGDKRARARRLRREGRKNQDV